MHRTAKFAKRSLRRFWRGLREWCGDAAYERYLHARGRQDGEQRTLSAEEFYVEQINRRYSRPNRCC
ncbi:MAG: CstA-like transporter-associated (seleno)protein [Candidatus Acidiferrales bacterium]